MELLLSTRFFPANTRSAFARVKLSENQKVGTRLGRGIARRTNASVNQRTARAPFSIRSTVGMACGTWCKMALWATFGEAAATGATWGFSSAEALGGSFTSARSALNGADSSARGISSNRERRPRMVSQVSSPTRDTSMSAVSFPSWMPRRIFVSETGSAAWPSGAGTSGAIGSLAVSPLARRSGTRRSLPKKVAKENMCRKKRRRVGSNGAICPRFPRTPNGREGATFANGPGPCRPLRIRPPRPSN